MFTKSNILKSFKTLSFRKYSPYSTKPSYIHKTGEDPLKYITIGQLLEQTANKFGERKAIISKHQNEFLTFSELLKKADKLAATLKVLNLEKNDRLGIWAPNLLEWCVTKMACARAGLISVYLNPVYEPQEMQHCVNKTGIKALVCADKFKHYDYYESLLDIAPELQNCDPGKLKSKNIPSLRTVIRISEGTERGTYNFQESLELANSTDVINVQKSQHQINPDDGCSLHFTSGTTGKPKAALVSHFKMVNNGFFLGKRTKLSHKHHKVCVQVPFFHVFGSVGCIMASLNYGSTMVLPTSGYQPDKTFDAIKEEKCTVICGTPTMYLDLIETKQKRKESISIEIATIGGAPNTPHLQKQITKILNVSEVNTIYGLTESTGAVFQSVPTKSEQNIVDYLHDHIEAKVIDESGGIVPFGTAGELCIRGYTNMLGYWDDEDKTNAILGKDGWLKTGDQFIIGEDRSGTVVGRLKDMIIRGGENIFPKEIEEFLITHPDILEIHVIGTPHKRLGEEVCACVRINPQSSLTLEEIVTFCKRKLAYFKIPTRIEIFDNFPRTASGKIQKFVLKEMLSEKDNEDEFINTKIYPKA